MADVEDLLADDRLDHQSKEEGSKRRAAGEAAADEMLTSARLEEPADEAGAASEYGGLTTATAMLRGSDSESSDAGQADAQPRAAEART